MASESDTERKRLLFEDHLNRIAYGHISFELYRAGFEFGLYDLLKKKPGLRLEEVASAISLRPYPAEVLLIGVAALDLVRKEGDKWYISEEFGKHLDSEKYKEFRISDADYMHRIVGPAARTLVDSLRAEKNLGLPELYGPKAANFYEELGKNEAHFASFTRRMSALTRLNIEKVAANPIFGQKKNVLDVGGNTGYLAIEITKHHKATRATTIDLPVVIGKTEALFKKSENSSRLAAIGSNIFTEKLPRGYDCIVFAHFTPIFSVSRVKKFLADTFEALDSGGCVCLYNGHADPNKPGSAFHGIFGAYFEFLAGGAGLYHEKPSYMAWMKEIGYAKIEVHPMDFNEALLIGHKA